jgi:hypothetical protein
MGISSVAILSKFYDSMFLRLILESNEKRKEEVKNESVWSEVEKIKKR